MGDGGKASGEPTGVLNTCCGGDREVGLGKKMGCLLQLKHGTYSEETVSKRKKLGHNCENLLWPGRESDIIPTE